MNFKFFRTNIFLLSIIIFFIVLLYSQAVSFGYTNWDTPHFILGNNFLQKLSINNLINIFTPGQMPKENLFIPITYLSYMFEISMFGTSPAVMHIDNILLHMLNSILLYFFVLLVFKKKSAAFFASLLFAIYPLQAEAVCWVMGRKDLMMTLFSLLTCISWFKKIKTKKSLYFCLSVIFLILASLSKPTALILPFLLCLISFYVDKEERNYDKIISIIPLFICSLIIFLINAMIPKVTETYALFKISSIAYIPSLLCGWLYRILMLAKPEIVYSINSLDSVFSSSLKLLVLLSVSAFIAYYIIKRKIKEGVFCILFILISFAPAFSAFFLAKRSLITADRYGYFPLIGFFILIGIIISEECKISEKTIKYTVAALWTILLIINTYKLIPVWKSTKSLWTYQLSINPDSPIGLQNLAIYYFYNGNEKTALKYLLKAAEIEPEKTTYSNIAKIYNGQKDFDKAIIYYKKAIELNPENPDYHGSLGTIYLKKGMLKQAKAEFIFVTEANPDISKPYFFLSEIYTREKDFEKAETLYRIYIEKKKREK